MVGSLRRSRSRPSVPTSVCALGYSQMVRLYRKGHHGKNRDMLQGPLQSERLAEPNVVRQTVSMATLKDRGAESRIVHPAYPMPDVEPRVSPPLARHVIRPARNVVARPIEVTRLQNVLVADRQGSLRTAEGRWIVDLSPVPTSLLVAALSRMSAAARVPARRLEGTTASLLSRGTNNYYHWLHQILPQIDAIRTAVPPSQIDRWLVPSLRPFSREILTRFGIPLAMVEEIGETPVVCDRLVVSSLPNMGAIDYPGEWPRRLLRDLYLPAENLVPWRRVYLRRGDDDRRPILNLAELDALLLREGFETHTLQGMRIEDQARLMAEAAVVVAPHGAGLANIVFCAPRTRIVELLPRLWPSPLYGMIAQACGLRHTFLPGTEPTLPFLRVRQVSAPTRVPIGRLARLLRRLDNDFSPKD